MSEDRHFTTRRGFITGMGFGAVGLYGVWAAYGAAPLPFGDHPMSVHEGHGEATEESGMTPDVFRRKHAAFVEKFRRPDGGVEPTLPQMMAHDMDHHSMSHHDMEHMSHEDAGGHPVDLYLLASMWSYSPGTLHLRTGVPYRWRMMADDIAHGASLQLGSASRIIRLRPDVVSEQMITFTKPGNILIYCTVYCGVGHDRMQGKIIVTASEPGGLS